MSAHDHHFVTDWKPLLDGRRMRVLYGMRLVKGNAEPYFSIIAEIQRPGRALGTWAEDSGGCLHAQIREHFPELAYLIRWHLFMPQGGPFHYVPNATFLWGQDNMGVFKAHVLLGELPEWDEARFSVLVTKDDVETWCLARLPALREHFKAAMKNAGIEIQ